MRTLFTSVLLAIVATGCRRGESIRRDAPPQQTSSTLCPLAGVTRITTELRLPARCQATIGGAGLAIDEGGKLIVEAGVDLAFAEGAALTMSNGVLELTGTEGAPVRLHATKGSFAGVAIDGASSVTLQHVHIADVKAALVDGRPRAALSIGPAARSVTIEDVQLLKADADGVQLGPGALVRGHRLTIELLGDHVAMRLSADDLGKLTDLHATAPIHVLDRFVHASATWSRTEAPLVLLEGLSIRARATEPVVTLMIADGNAVRVGFHRSIDVGDGGLGALKAHGVRFDSAESKPARGDWRGMHLIDAAGSEISDCTVAHAGIVASDPQGVIRVRKPTGVVIVGTKFVDDVGAAIEAHGDCARFVAPASRNDFGSLPGCIDSDAATRARIEALRNAMEMRLIGALSSPGGTSGVLSSSSAEPFDLLGASGASDLARARSGGAASTAGGGAVGRGGGGAIADIGRAKGDAGTK